MSPEVVEHYHKAGRVIAEVREKIKDVVKEGMPILTLCEEVEFLIKEMHCKPAFPCNVDVNEVAAHYTSPADDVSFIPSGSVVKIDLGAHVNGYIADTAVTLSFDANRESMVWAVEEALERAVAMVRPGVKLSEVGSVIERTIRAHGYKPVRNLSGHLIERFVVHGPISVPNVTSLQTGKFEADCVYAIEPFATSMDAAGEVINRHEAFIYHMTKPKPPKNRQAEQLLDCIKAEYWTLPFAKRWLKGMFLSNRLEEAFKTLLTSRCIQPYPVLVERTAKPVAQAEHTLLVTEKEAVILTL